MNDPNKSGASNSLGGVGGGVWWSATEVWKIYKRIKYVFRVDEKTFINNNNITV